MRKILLILTLFILAGCQTIFEPQSSEEPEVVPPITEPEKPTEPIVVQPPITEIKPVEPIVIEPPKKIYMVDWRSTVKLLLDNMNNSVSNEVKRGSILLVDSIDNKTGRQIKVTSLENAIIDQLINRNLFTVLPDSQLSSARQALGLSANDSLVSRSKIIGLARSVNANYILLTKLSGDNVTPRIEMQLMVTDSGELIWSGAEQTKKVEVTDRVHAIQ